MGKQWKQWKTLFWGPPKSLYMVTFSHEIKRQLFLGRKILTNLDSVLKSRNITLPTKVHLIKVKVFLVVMYGCELDYKVEHQRIEGFKLWGWRRLLRVPLTARRSNQSILKEISPGCSLEGLILKLKLQYFGHLMQRVDSLEKTVMLREIGGRRRGGRQRMRWMAGWHHWLNGHEFGWTPGVGNGQGGLACCGPWGHKESDMTEWLRRKNWFNIYFSTSIFILFNLPIFKDICQKVPMFL